MFCSKCGTKFESDDDMFCPKCGAKRPMMKGAATTTQQNTSEVSTEPMADTEQVASPEPVAAEEAEPVASVEEVVVTEPVAAADEVVDTEPIAEAVTESSESNSNPAAVMEESVQSQEEPVSQTANVNLQKPDTASEKPAIPEGFILDPASGWFYKSKAKQLPNGAYVNEITWFEPTSGKMAVKEYPMSEQQVRVMLAQSNQNSPKYSQGAYQQNGQYNYQQNSQMNSQNNYQQHAAMNGQNNYQQAPMNGQNNYQQNGNGMYQNAGMQQNGFAGQNGYAGQSQQNGYGQQNTYNQQQSSTMVPVKKSKKGLIIGISAGVIVVVVLVVCAFLFDWFKFGKKDEPSEPDTPTVTLAPTPTIEPTSTPEPTPTEEPQNPLGELNKDYIVIKDQEFKTTETSLYLEYLGLSNEDIESLQYMKHLQSLDLKGNDLTSLDSIKGLTTLTSLDASENEIYDINALSDLVNLESITMDETKISDLSPLKNMTALQSLSVKGTDVMDLSPLKANTNLAYLYVADTKVDDYTCLDDMPNLFMCDSYDLSSNGNNGDPVPTGEPAQGSGYTFTDDDRIHFVPATDNYIIGTVTAGNYEQLVLFSYDDNGKCVQIRFRQDIGVEMDGDALDEYSDYLAEELDAVNVECAGTILYFDYAPDEDEFNMTKDEVVEEFSTGGAEIVANSDGELDQ